MWAPYGCPKAMAEGTDKWGFRQCIVPGGRPKKSERERKIKILNDLKNNRQVLSRWSRLDAAFDAALIYYGLYSSPHESP